MGQISAKLKAYSPPRESGMIGSQNFRGAVGERDCTPLQPVKLRGELPWNSSVNMSEQRVHVLMFERDIKSGRNSLRRFYGCCLPMVIRFPHPTTPSSPRSGRKRLIYDRGRSSFPDLTRLFVREFGEARSDFPL